MSYTFPEEWGKGPWLEESPGNIPIEGTVTFLDKEKGNTVYNTWMKRNHCGSWCAYIQIPIDSPWSKEEYYQGLQVHGGITWYWPHLPWEPESEVDHSAYFYLGFDCAHSTDVVPSIEDYFLRTYSSPFAWIRTYRTEAFVREELNTLARQLQRGPLEARKAEHVSEQRPLLVQPTQE